MPASQENMKKCFYLFITKCYKTWLKVWKQCCCVSIEFVHHMDGLVQDCGISSASALEIPVLHQAIDTVKPISQ